MTAVVIIITLTPDKGDKGFFSRNQVQISTDGEPTFNQGHFLKRDEEDITTELLREGYRPYSRCYPVFKLIGENGDGDIEPVKLEISFYKEE